MLLLLLLLLLLLPFFCQQCHGLLGIWLPLFQRKFEQHFSLIRIRVNAVPVQVHDAHVQRGGCVSLTRRGVCGGEEVERFGVVAVAEAHVPVAGIA